MNLLRKTINLFRGAEAAPAPNSQAPDATLTRIILPDARDRWQMGSVAQYTPDRIEQVIRGALTGNLVSVWELYDLMEATWPRLQKNLNELKDEVASATWIVQPWALKGQKPTAEAQRRASLLDQALWSMRPRPESDENEFRATVKDLLDAWGKGIAVLEIDWQLKSLGGQNLFVPRDTRWIHPRYYGYPINRAELMLNTVEVNRAGAGLSDIPAQRPLDSAGQWAPFPQNKFLIGICKQKSGHPAGGALLRALAFWWCASNFSAEWFLNFCQIFGLPIRWATYAADKPGLLQQICDMLENMGSAGWGAFPAGTTIELKEPAKGANQIPQAAMLDRADKQCDLLILGQTLTSDVGESGSRALGDVHLGILTGRKKVAGDWVASALSQQLSPAFCRLNFSDDNECPWLLVTTEGEEAPLEMAKRDEILLRNQIPMPQEWFYERHKVPMPAAGDQVIIGQPQAAPGFGDGETANGNGGSYQGKDATDLLTDHVLENLTGVQARWLGGVKPFFVKLIRAAQDQTLTDKQFEEVLVRAKQELPELFDKIDHDALAQVMEEAMSAALVNGVAKGVMRRRPAAMASARRQAR